MKPFIRPRKILTEEKFAQKLVRMCKKDGLWPAAEYPTKYSVNKRHGVWGVTIWLNTDRVFDVKIKERRL